MTLASGSLDKTVRLWDARTGEHKKTLEGHSDSVRCVAFSPDGLTLASGGDIKDKTIRLWDVPTGALRLTLDGNTNRVSSIAYSPDGATLASCSDGIIRIWDARSGKEQQVLKPSSGGSIVAYSPVADTLVSAGGKSIRLWDTRTLTLLKNLETTTGSVTSVGLTPDGNTLATGSSDGTILVWDLTPSTAEDVNSDGIVNVLDLVSVGSRFGQSGHIRTDVNKDGVVDITDLIMVAAAIEAWTAALYVHPQSAAPEVLEIIAVEDVKKWLRITKQMEQKNAYTCKKGLRRLKCSSTGLTGWKSSSSGSDFPKFCKVGVARRRQIAAWEKQSIREHRIFTGR